MKLPDRLNFNGLAAMIAAARASMWEPSANKRRGRKPRDGYGAILARHFARKRREAYEAKRAAKRSA